MTAPGRNRARSTLLALSIGALLASVTLAIYWPAFAFGIVSLDDHGYVGPFSGPVNGGLSINSVIWAFTTSHMANWHPLTWLSLMLDRTICPHGWEVFHVTNVILHVINTLLLFGVLRLMTGATWASALVAALFAWHPAHVESVAWISERKDVLSAMFWMLVMLTWTLHARSEQPRSLWYVLCAVILALGLMAKPMLVTLPCVLLLLDFWPLRRLGRGREQPTLRALVREKIPLLIIAAVSCLITYLVQRNLGGVTDVRFAVHAANAPVSYIRYLGVMFWPMNLTAFYPLPGVDLAPWPLWMVGLSAASIVAITLMVVALRRRAPHLVMGWLWYLGTLVPVIGLVVFVGFQAMADRYTYIPFIGLFIALAWTLRDIVRWRQWLAVIVVPLVLMALSTLAWQGHRQVDVWRDTDALYEHAIAINPDDFRIHRDYGDTLLARDRPADAEMHYRRCVELRPADAESHSNLGLSQIALKRYTAAARAFERTVELQPDNAVSHYNLGFIAMQTGDDARSLRHLQRAVELAPDNPDYRQTYEAIRERLPESGGSR